MLQKNKLKRPPIVITSDEQERLTELALSAMDRAPGAADLFVELSRARAVKRLPERAIGIDSVVTFDYDGVRYQDYMLVDPHRADFANQRISVITTVGAMLLGLSEGQTIEWVGEDGRARSLTVEAVRHGA